MHLFCTVFWGVVMLQACSFNFFGSICRPRRTLVLQVVCVDEDAGTAVSETSGSQFHDRILFASSFVSSSVPRTFEDSMDGSSPGGSSGICHRPLTVIIDGDNVRGKTGFRLSKEQLVDGVARYLSSDRVRLNSGNLSISCAVVFDHGSRHQAFSLSAADLPLSNRQTDEGNLLSNKEGISLSLAMVFSGPSLTADDVIARDSTYIENWGYTQYAQSIDNENSEYSEQMPGMLPPPRVVVVTQDNGLRKRCKPKSVRMTKAERKVKDKERARREKRGGETAAELEREFKSDLCVVSSKMLADLLLGMYTESEAPLSCVLTDKELVAKKALLLQEVDLSRKLAAQVALLENSTSRKAYPKLQAQVDVLRHNLDSIRIFGNGENCENGGAQLVERGSAFLRGLIPEPNEDTLERVLLAEDLRKALMSRPREGGLAGGGGTGQDGNGVLGAYVRRINTKFGVR